MVQLTVEFLDDGARHHD